LDRHRPWGVSPVSFLEIQFLAHVGRLSVRNPEFTNTVMEDTRFTVDDIPLATIVRHALPLDWTRFSSPIALLAALRFVPPTAASAPITGLLCLSPAHKYRRSTPALLSPSGMVSRQGARTLSVKGFMTKAFSDLFGTSRLCAFAGKILLLTPSIQNRKSKITGAAG
jgi:hypothetical protein